MALLPSATLRSVPLSWLRGVAGAAVVLLTATACSAAGSIENTDVPAWQATALPSASGVVLEDSGRILNREGIVRSASVPAGTYTLTLTCEGGGKAFLAIKFGGKDLLDTGAACNGSRETAKVRVPETGTLEISASSVDAPLIFAYQLVPA